jgi:acyl dehydratase
VTSPDGIDIEERWTVTREAVVRYAGASLDFNAIHLDNDAARDAGYDGVIAHGMLTMGRALSAVAGDVGPLAITSCSGRFAAPALAGSTLSTRVTGQVASAVSVSVVDDSTGGLVLDLGIELGGPPEAEPLDGPILADRVLVVERGPAVRFAEALGASEAHYTDASAAQRAGLAGIPVVPTFAFALPGWGWFPDCQAVEGGRAPDAVRDCQAWTDSDAAVIHAGQAFAYHRPLYVGDVVRSRTHEVARSTKEGRSGTLHFTVVANRLTDHSGRPVLTSTMTLLVRKSTL